VTWRSWVLRRATASPVTLFIVSGSSVAADTETELTTTSSDAVLGMLVFNVIELSSPNARVDLVQVTVWTLLLQLHPSPVAETYCSGLGSVSVTVMSFAASGPSFATVIVKVPLLDPTVGMPKLPVWTLRTPRSAVAMIASSSTTALLPGFGSTVLVPSAEAVAVFVTVSATDAPMSTTRVMAGRLWPTVRPAALRCSHVTVPESSAQVQSVPVADT
jgi:hypothetical protein